MNPAGVRTTIAAVHYTGANFTNANLTNAVWLRTRCPNGQVQNTPCSPLFGPGGGASVLADTGGGADKLRVDIEPDLGSGAWTFTIEQLMLDGSWAVVGTFVSEGPNERWSDDLPAGTYRAVVSQHGGNPPAVSEPVVLTR